MIDMKLIKTYAGVQALKHIQFSSIDKKEFIKRFDIPEPLAERLCLYLADKKEVVDMKECYDPQSGWRGFDFCIGNKNLSLNGYRFRPNNVESFLNGEWE